MAVTATPIFVQAPRTAMAQILTANTNRDGSGTLGTVWTAPANGSKIEHIDIVATGSVSNGVVRLYIHDGATARLWKEILVPATVPSVTVAVFSSSIDCSQGPGVLVLQTAYSLRASTHIGETFNVIAIGGDF